MTVTLPKGGNLLLADEAPGISQLRVGLGWNPGPAPAGAPLELDVVVSVITETAPGGTAAARPAGAQSRGAGRRPSGQRADRR